MILTRPLIGSVLCAWLLVGVCAAAPEEPSKQPTSTQSSPQPPAAAKPPASPLPLKSDDVLTYVSHTVDWYRGLQNVEQLQGTPQDLLARDRLHDQAVTAVRLAFEFGRAAASILNAQAAVDDSANDSGESKGFAGQLDRVTDRVGGRVAALQSQLAALDEQLAHASKSARATLSAQRGNVSAALALAREVLASLQDIERFEDYALVGDAKGEGGLAAQIAELEKSVPEATPARKGAPAAGGSAPATGQKTSGGSVPAAASSTSATANAAAASSAAQAATAALRPESAGVIALAGEWFSLHGSRGQLNAAIKQTDALVSEADTRRRAIGRAVSGIVGGAFASSTTADATQLNAQRAALEAGAAQFKKLATVLVPVGEQALTLESAGNTLRDWRAALGERSANVSRYLALRIGFLLASVAVVFVISEIWRRATVRYLHDLRLRRQLTLVRRIVIGIALTAVVVFGLVSEIGSVATYAGFVTAGIAVALQNVILAIVAYFFLIGRYGVRVGDRVTMAGVTGRVVEIGLVRIYLMELSGPELHATGRVVVLSNAVLFQPTAMFKQIPGAEYVWHSITLTLAATADVVDANKRLKEAADAVYATYRPDIERQYAIVQRLLDFDTSTPQPEVRVRWSESGLDCSVRYPVEPESSASVDQQMLKAMRDALAKDPPLKLLSTNAVALKTDGP
jgi:small-conductance mechanosensitive channel